MKPTRRNLFQAAAAASTLAASAKAGKISSKPSAEVYERLGVKPVINGMGTVTVLGGSLIPPEVVRAMDEASLHFVHLPDLQKKAGAHIAGLLNVPAAMVTGGAASSIAVGTAACMARGDRKKLWALPSQDGPFEVIQQKSHHDGYEHQMQVVGGKVISIETAAELENAISARTAMMFYLNKAENHGKIQREEWVRIAKKHGVPTFNDAAADVPPKENLWNYVTRDGFDLVAFSGGKGMLGPQCSGLLLGRKDLIEAATEAQSPYAGVGRGMKVGKEEIVGMVAALERFLKADHEAESRELDRRVTEMTATLSKIDGLKLSRQVPQIANQVPHLMIEWDEAKLKPAREIHHQLIESDPAIYTLLQGKGKIMVSVWMMHGNEHRIVAKRFAELFRA
ncbi:MAG: aminotransferase class V-fold PLP-dependent enzyme [Bryobacterales bacterium]|nr:aminotransferase class V-fold PLP-dependent enzyme [Bryobacterales bacterium]